MIMSFTMPRDILVNRMRDFGCVENQHYKFIGRGTDIDMYDVPYVDADETDIMW